MQIGLWPIIHPNHQQSTTREPVKGCALLRFAPALRVTNPAYVLRRALIGTKE